VPRLCPHCLTRKGPKGHVLEKSSWCPNFDALVVYCWWALLIPPLSPFSGVPSLPGHESPHSLVVSCSLSPTPTLSQTHSLQVTISLSLSKDPASPFSFLSLSQSLPPCSCIIKSWSKLLQQFNSSRIHCQSVWQMNERWLIWTIVNWLDVWHVQSLAQVENSRTNWGLDKVLKQKGLQLQSFAKFSYELF
jgi:hypothetical protein